MNCINDRNDNSHTDHTHTHQLDCREIELTKDQQEPYEDDAFIRRRNHCTIFLGYTSNMVSSGLRETIRFLVQHKLVDCIVATAGGVEEDFIKCLAPTYVGSFELNGGELRDKGINRIGNLLVPNENYCKFENWVLPLLDEMLAEQKEHQVLWSPSKMIQRYDRCRSDGRVLPHSECSYFMFTI